MYEEDFQNRVLSEFNKLNKRLDQIDLEISRVKTKWEVNYALLEDIHSESRNLYERFNNGVER